MATLSHFGIEQGSSARLGPRDYRRDRASAVVHVTGLVTAGKTYMDQMDEATAYLSANATDPLQTGDHRRIVSIDVRPFVPGEVIGRVYYAVDESTPYPGNPWATPQLSMDLLGEDRVWVPQIVSGPSSTSSVAAYLNIIRTPYDDYTGEGGVFDDPNMIRMLNKRVVSRTIRVPFVLDSNPELVAEAYDRNVNSDAVDIFGVERAPATLRFEGIGGLNGRRLYDGTTLFVGYYEFTYLPHGYWSWRRKYYSDGYYPPGYTGTLPWYRVKLELSRYLEYPTSTFAGVFPTGAVQPGSGSTQGYGPAATSSPTKTSRISYINSL